MVNGRRIALGAAVAALAAAVPIVVWAPAAQAATPTLLAYVTNFDDDTVTPIDLTTHTPATPIPVGDAPVGVAFTPDGATAYIVNSGADTVTPITVATGAPGTPVPVGDVPVEVVVTPDGATAYVS